MTDIKQKKEILRRECRQLTKSLEQKYVESSNHAIEALLTDMPEWKSARNIFIYISVGNEPDTRKIINGAFACGKTVAVPRCVGNGVMEARIIKGFFGLSEKSFGIPEPDESFPIMPKHKIDLVVVPCVCADLSLNRLGNGAGYYDRYLSDIFCETVCLCRGRLLVEKVPTESSDTPVCALICENGLFRAAKRQASLRARLTASRE